MKDGSPHAMATECLSRAYALADAGEADSAAALAQSILDDLLRPPSDAVAAEAVLCLACCELRLYGRFLNALTLSQRATTLFQRAGDSVGECRALATLATAATRLGHHERAVESALLAVRLAESLLAERELVGAYHALGIAAFCGRNFAEAHNAYQRAIQLAQRCEPPLNAFELHVDLASTEAYRYFQERSAGGRRLHLGTMERHVAEGRRLLGEADDAVSLAPASHANNRLIHALTETHLFAWRGRHGEARRALARLKAEFERMARPWMAAAVEWGDAEVALAEGDWEGAEAMARRMVAIGRAHHHQTFTGIGYQLASYVCESCGDAAGALRALREMLQCEQTARADSLKSRVDVVEWQLELRGNKERLRRLETDSRLFQKLAMEDALTSLPNRRQFEAALDSALESDREPATAPCIAIIDVDRFKRINDDFSHNVGDEVLRRIADAMRAEVGLDDLPARLGGDEFAMLLRHASIADASAVCERLRGRVLESAWDKVAPGLAVSISVGVAQAVAGEAAEALLQRSDGGMYAAKRRREGSL